jgi:hypothetical protein
MVWPPFFVAGQIPARSGQFPTMFGVRRKPSAWDRVVFKRGYRDGRAQRPWSGGRTNMERDPYARGWLLGHQVARRLARLDVERTIRGR